MYKFALAIQMPLAKREIYNIIIIIIFLDLREMCAKKDQILTRMVHKKCEQYKSNGKIGKSGFELLEKLVP